MGKGEYKVWRQFREGTVLQGYASYFDGAQMSHLHEGPDGSRTVSTGMINSKTPDPGGVSYGSFQFTSQCIDDKGVKREGTVQDFMRSKEFEPFKDKFKDKNKDGHPLKVNSEAFKDAWRNMDDPIGFEHAQYDYAMKRYHEPQMKKLEKAGFDATGRSEAFDNAVTSASVQHGQNTSVVVNGLKHKAEELNKPLNELSDREAITGIYEQRARVNKTTLERYAPEMREDLEMLRRERGELAPPPLHLSPDHERRDHHHHGDGTKSLTGNIIPKGHNVALAPSHMSPSHPQGAGVDDTALQGIVNDQGAGAMTGAAVPVATPGMAGTGGPADLLVAPLGILQAVTGQHGNAGAPTAGDQESGVEQDPDDPFGKKGQKGGQENKKKTSGNLVSDYMPGMTPR